MKYSVFGMVFLSLIGCTTNDEKRINPNNADIAETNIPLFAKLENVNGDYLFTKFANKNPNLDNEPWVNMKTGSPTWDIKTSKMWQRAYKRSTQRSL